MGEFFDRLFDSGEADTIFGFALIFGIGAFLYIMNWSIFFNDLNPKKKWVSMVPPLGGLLIAIGILIAGGGWWALLGLTDPCVWAFIYPLVKETKNDRDKPEKTENKDETNGKHDD